MRHGARSTCGLLPWETKESFAADWQRCHDSSQHIDDPVMQSCAVGQLTVSGEKMCVELGKRFRERYVSELKFLDEQVDTNAMHFESTMVRPVFVVVYYGQ